MSEHGKHIAIGIVASVVLVLGWMWHNSDVEAAADRAQLTATLKQQGDVISQLQRQIGQRDAAAVEANKVVDHQVSAAKTDPQIAALITQLVGLKQPIIVQTPATKDGKVEPDAPSYVMTSQQGRELLDFSASCKKCQNDLVAAQGAREDQTKQIAALTQERDVAVKAAHGGSRWQRMKRAAKWFGVGTLAGGAVAGILKH